MLGWVLDEFTIAHFVIKFWPSNFIKIIQKETRF